MQAFYIDSISTRKSLNEWAEYLINLAFRVIYSKEERRMG
nr:MAG TPA: hypothetical protein [Caudoviricetes sp.]DAT88014.1 MAG TPA: hypothetical protein [Caudoviricetes sp.]